MKIEFDAKHKMFQLTCPEMCYAFAITESGRLMNIHWGTPLENFSDYEMLLDDPTVMTPYVKRSYNRAEYRTGDPFDYCTPCLRVQHADGAETLRMAYASHKIEGDTLYVTMKDTYYPVEVELRYKTWGDLPLIGRSAVIRNLGDAPIILNTAKSASLHMPYARDYRLTHYAGEWGAEYQKNQTMLTQARVQLETSHLTDAASHQLPFFALDENGTATETTGEVYFGVLAWSGDFQITVEKLHAEHAKNVTVTAGISDFTARYPLGAGESFETPMFTVGFSNRGFEHMSEIFYDWQFDYTLPRGKKTDKAHAVRPVIYNTWYPYEFNLDEQKLIDFIPKAKYIGAELYVIDDGWMKKRSSQEAGLGDWIVDRERFPKGLSYISDKVHEAGMLFGLWVEPEMVNPDSDLYREHPDWVLSEPNRDRTLSRVQLVLDMSRDDITDWAIEWLDKLIIEAKLDYLKWDMNREVTETGLFARDRAVAIKYMRNIYRIWQHLNEKFPDLLLENCASGGGRADFGMAPYADRVNRSDNADPIDVMLLHEGYSTFFVPKLAGGAGNVAPSPSHQNGRRVPLEYRINSGMTGSMSVGINLLKSDQEELDALKAALVRFKELRPALQDAYVYRIASANENRYSVLQYTKRDRSQFTVFAFGHGMHQWDKQLPRFKMRGLDPEAVYTDGQYRMTGKALMTLGVKVSLRGDYSSQVQTWKKV